MKIMDSEARANERALMCPVRNCLVVGVSNCGRNLWLARQTSRRNFKSFNEQDLSFHMHELPEELFDAFLLEELGFCLVLSHQGELFKLPTKLGEIAAAAAPRGAGQMQAETLMLRDSCATSIGENERIKLRLASLDLRSKLLWIYIDSEETTNMANQQQQQQQQQQLSSSGNRLIKLNNNNPFCGQESEHLAGQWSEQASGWPLGEGRKALQSIAESCMPDRPMEQQANRQQASVCGKQRKILIIDVITFDLFSAFTIPSSFGEITNLRASLVAYFQLANPLSSQFSSRIVQLAPNGHYEQLLSFADVVDYLVSVPESFGRREGPGEVGQQPGAGQKYSSLKRLLKHSISFSSSGQANLGTDTSERQQKGHFASGLTSSKAWPIPERQETSNKAAAAGATLSKYYKSLIRSYSTAVEQSNHRPEPDGRLPCASVQSMSLADA